ncbi:MAG: lipoate protein ligase C-terminal domain-containing protein [Candidatus Heimdallarchaeota archaeon]|nr:MAG: hypothetical protein DRO63_00070 [Candidatus Gerdarchaeota archaeon]RLI72683.1 MAG: hypothetical protein DRP02_00825 [Candidatus Gerdarchaeota archaeon]
MKTARVRTKKGVIEVELLLSEGKIEQISLTGDFFVYPEDSLEQFENSLIGVPINKEALSEVIAAFYSKQQFLTPGITVEDWVTVIFQAANS